jgi:hypothetical protein
MRPRHVVPLRITAKAAGDSNFAINSIETAWCSATSEAVSPVPQGISRLFSDPHARIACQRCCNAKRTAKRLERLPKPILLFFLVLRRERRGLDGTLFHEKEKRIVLCSHSPLSSKMFIKVLLPVAVSMLSQRRCP